MSATRTCPQCGAELRDDALEGLCQDCLGKLALGVGDPLNVESSGQRFGDYELIEEIAHGGMGVVYKARQVSLNRTVAVKMIRAGQFASKEFVHRFRVEASAAAVLQHPNIVAVHEVGVHEGQHFFSMDYVAGKNLAQIVRDGPLTPNRAARYVQKIAEAIHYAHQSGILHRDLKPSNVLIDQNDQPRITDFGLAKQLNSESSATLTGEVMGTPGYMPPEQASGNRGAVKAWSDVYSLGAVLYHLLTGRAPFAAGSLEETLNQVLHRDPISVRLLTPGVPRDLDTICLKCLEKEPAKRYASAQMLAEELARFLNKEPILARPISTAGKAWRWCRRKPALATALGLLVVVAVGSPIAAIRINQTRKAEQHQRQRAESTVTRLEIERAEMLFATDNSAEALAYLARVLRREPTNRVAGERIISALAYRNFCVPLFRLELKGTATAAEFSPDGQRVLTASKDGRAQIWDGRTGQPLLGPFQHDAEVTTAHYSSNGARLVTASLDKTARVWDARTGRPLTELLRHDGGVLCADFSPDGQRLATGSADRSLRLWNVETGTLLGTPVRIGGGVDFVKFSPDGRYIVLLSKEALRTHLVNAFDGTELAAVTLAGTFVPGPPGPFPSFSADGTSILATLGGGSLTAVCTTSPFTNRVSRSVHKNGTTCMRFSPDGQTLASGSTDSIAKLSDADTFQPVAAIPHEDWVNSIEFSPDGGQVVTGSRNRTARIWDAHTGRPLSERLRHDASVWSTRFSPDGQRILSRCDGPGVWVWEIRSGQPLTASLQHSDQVRKAVFSPDGERAATTEWTGGSGVVRLWDARRGIPLLPPLGSGLWDVQFSRDSRQLLALDYNFASTVWDTRDGKLIGGTVQDTNAWHTGPKSARFSPDGQLVVASEKGRQVKVWRIATGEVVRNFLHEDRAGFAQFSPDGQWVITTSEDKTARLWDWATGQSMTEPLRHDDAVFWADVSADSRRVVTISRDKTARIWAARTGEHLHTLTHANDPYPWNSVQFSPDGRLVVTAAGNAAQIWSSDTGQPVTAALKHDGRVNSVRFSPDGKRLVTSSLDGTARVWDTSGGHPLSEPIRHRERVNYAEFSPDGRRIITASMDGTARIWELPVLSSSVPRWLADWAEAVAGQRIDAQNTSQAVPFDELHRLRQGLGQAAEGDEAARWARWFFAENATRTISHGSPISLSEYVERRIEDGTLESLGQAVRLSPTNGLAQGRLALLTLMSEAQPSPRQTASPDWQSRHAVALAPENPEVLCARAELCERLGRVSEAWELMEQGSRLQPAHPSFWKVRGRMLEQTNRLEEAYQAYGQALSLAGSNWVFLKIRNDVLLRRSDLLRRLNRPAESRADYERLLETEFTALEANNLAWALVTGPPESRDPERAILLAQKAVRLTPKDANMLSTLGVVYYRAGNYGKALETLLESGKLNPDGPTASDLFFLAMSHQQLGDSGPARAYFERALQWCRDHPAEGSSKAMQSFQAEAEALLNQERRP